MPMSANVKASRRPRDQKITVSNVSGAKFGFFFPTEFHQLATALDINLVCSAATAVQVGEYMCFHQSHRLPCLCLTGWSEHL